MLLKIAGVGFKDVRAVRSLAVLRATRTTRASRRTPPHARLRATPGRFGSASRFAARRARARARAGPRSARGRRHVVLEAEKQPARNRGAVSSSAPPHRAAQTSDDLATYEKNGADVVSYASVRRPLGPNHSPAQVHEEGSWRRWEIAPGPHLRHATRGDT